MSLQSRMVSEYKLTIVHRLKKRTEQNEAKSKYQVFKGALKYGEKSSMEHV